MLKVNRRKYLGGESDQLCHERWFPPLYPGLWGYSYLVPLGTVSRPSEQAASMCLMGTTLTIVNQKDVWDVFSRG